MAEMSAREAVSAAWRIQHVAETLRFLAGGMVANPDPHAEGPGGPSEDQKWMLDVAEQLERDQDPSGWFCCPLCEETVCDDDCPLAYLTRYRAVAPPGHPGARP